MKRAIFALAILTVFWCSAANAYLIFTSGNNLQPDGENIQFDGGSTAFTVYGQTNTSNRTVNFSSTELLIEPSLGQARIEAYDGLINYLTISVPGAIFTDIIFNLGCPPGSPGCGTAEVSVTATDGIFDFSYGLGPGQNFLTITASSGEMHSVSIFDATGFKYLRQPRISGLDSRVSANPIPSSILLLASGLIGLWGARRMFNK